MVKYLVKDLKADIGQLGLDWNGVDYLTISPLVSAILYDSSSQQNIINYLMDQDAADESSVILNSVKSSNIPLQEKTDILEFAGAAYILRAEEEDDGRLLFGKKFWFETMALRDESTIKKMLTQFSEWVRKKCEIDEFTAMEKLLKDLEIGGILSIASFKFEALLVIDRIGSRIFPGPHPYFLRQLVVHAFNQIENPTIRLDMLMLSLEMFQLGQWKLNSEWAGEIVCDAIVWIVASFNKLLNLPVNHPARLVVGCLGNKGFALFVPFAL